jgi:uncharacterized membrane protein
LRPRPFTVLFIVAALAGAWFTGFSTADFASHLDRQMHDIHCAWAPGLVEGDSSASSGCQVTMMSPYSSVFRTLVWGGIPIALPGLATFAFLVFRGLDLILNRRQGDREAARFLVFASLVPVLTSVVMGYLSIVELGTTCKLCVGTYISSAACLAFAIGAWRSAMAPVMGEDIGIGADPAGDVPEGGSGLMGTVVGFATLGGFVAVPSLVYLILAPDFTDFVGACGSLPAPEDKYGIMIPLDESTAGRAAIEVFDPLCPACKGFEERLEASGLGTQLHRSAVLFPLDQTCNWNVGETLHPGACTVSEAILCAEGNSHAVIAWAFENQEAIRTAALADPASTAAMVGARFPELKSCLGTPAVKTKLNRSLKWAVANHLPILTPQLYVEGVKLCDEDTDLGMDWALSRLLANPTVKATP